ncbi:hypothetical protein HUU40_12505 [candidate division KSB1 bacterium]|nr:hypothetical protein [candidate division KSB1 bacterium]
MENNDDIIYSLNIDDVQTVAMDEIGRELSLSEIKSIEDLIGDNINWYDAILDAINAKILQTTSEND